jgi:hypothetical protein
MERLWLRTTFITPPTKEKKMTNGSLKCVCVSLMVVLCNAFWAYSNPDIGLLTQAGLDFEASLVGHYSDEYIVPWQGPSGLSLAVGPVFSDRLFLGASAGYETSPSGNSIPLGIRAFFAPIRNKFSPLFSVDLGYKVTTGELQNAGYRDTTGFQGDLYFDNGPYCRLMGGLRVQIAHAYSLCFSLGWTRSQEQEYLQYNPDPGHGLYVSTSFVDRIAFDVSFGLDWVRMFARHPG